MTESYIQLPADSTGKKLRTRQRVVGADTVEEQYSVAASLPTYYFWSGYSAGAANKIYLDVFNASGSGKVLRLRKLFVQSTVAAVTGVGFQFDLDRTTAAGTGGTVLTGNPADTADGALPAQVTARTVPTGGATKQLTLFPVTLSSEETQAGAHFNWAHNVIPESPEVKEPIIREGQGVRLVQITSSTAGTWGVLAVVTTD